MSSLESLGGKGANLVRLREAGFAVPEFVVVPTSEYDAFVTASGLQPLVDAALHGIRHEADHASDTIRAAFSAADMTRQQRDRILELAAPLLGGPVAVRSSATAEDLPDLSFAGQQDTFLDVSGADELCVRVVDCWSSLWTARAIIYRARNAIPHAGVRLAVVIQRMVPADVSGVLFTANPLTGRRDESVVDAVAGLGDALVSGRTTPDNYVLETSTAFVRARILTGARPLLGPVALGELAGLSRRVDREFGQPQDVEWVLRGAELLVVQSRPITNLYPVPQASSDELTVWFSLGAFQGMLEPFTPLGQDALRFALTAAARLAGRDLDWHTNTFIQSAGERLWLRIDGLVRQRVGRTLLLKGLPMVEPGTAAVLARLLDDPRLAPRDQGRTPQALVGWSRFLTRVWGRVPHAVAHPEQARADLDAATDSFVAEASQRLDAAGLAGDPGARLTARVRAIEELLGRVFPVLLPVFGPIMVPSMAMVVRLRHLARATGLADADALALTILRSLPGNVTTEMDLALSDAARLIRADATAWGWLAMTEPALLAVQYRAGRLPRVAQEAIGSFLERYGMRGVAEIDLGAPRWRDDPEAVMQTLQSYLIVDDPERLPRAVHARGEVEATEAVERLAATAGPLAARQIRFMAASVRGMFGARETPKFTIVKVFGLMRDALDASARDLVAAGLLAQPSDVYFLGLDELGSAFARDHRADVAARRAVREREARRGRVPRVLLGDGRAFHEGLEGADGGLRGSGVSPGVAEGPVRVVVDPRTSQLAPGEILVCAGTDPAWTPLFMAAAGLVTEVGGLMTHGSVVAREYGIPAVVGVHEATTRLVTGQRIRLDGTTGAIEVL